MKDINEVLRAVFAEADEKLVLDELGESKHRFSLSFQKKLNKNTASFFKNGKYVGEAGSKKTHTPLVRRIIAVACVLLVFAGVAFNADAIGDLFARWLITPDTSSTHVSFEIPDGVTVPETIEKRYYLANIPEEYSHFDSTETPFYCSSVYKDNNDNYFVFSQYCFNYINSVLDTEDSKVNELSINGNKGYSIEKEGATRIIWENGEYCFVLQASFGYSVDDLIKIGATLLDIE